MFVIFLKLVWINKAPIKMFSLDDNQFYSFIFLERITSVLWMHPVHDSQCHTLQGLLTAFQILWPALRRPPAQHPAMLNILIPCRANANTRIATRKYVTYCAWRYLQLSGSVHFWVAVSKALITLTDVFPLTICFCTGITYPDRIQRLFMIKQRRHNGVEQWKWNNGTKHECAY